MKYAYKSLKLLFKKYPANILLQIAWILASVVMMNIPIYLVRNVVSLYEEGGEVKTMIAYVVIAGIILLVAYLFSIFVEYYNDYVERNFKADLAIMLYSKLDKIDYDFHESPEFLNDYTRALELGTDRIYLTARGAIDTIRVLIQSLSIFIVIFSMHYLAVIYAILIGIIYMVLRFRIGKLRFHAVTVQRPFYRQRNYVNRTFFIKDAMADLKTTEIDQILLANNEKANNGIIEVIDKVTLKVSALTYIGEVLISSIYPITLGILAYVTIDNINFADFSALTIAATTLSTLVAQFVWIFADLQNNALECKIPFEVLNMSSKIEGVTYEDVDGDFQSLEIKNLYFSYDGKNDTLKDINMKINKGERIAIVGGNGAGKTTLVKLLLRLYDASSGAIYINGDDYRNITASSLREQVGAVFQNVEVYAASIAENIIFKKPETEEETKLVIDALKFSGLYDYVNSLEDGIDTEITREFRRQGAIFSGGQMQRLAISRGYAQNYNLFILDEPSSALDPLAEAGVYNNMLKLGKDRTIVFISHRLTTTVNADCIYLFEDGKIIESGTHEELLKLNRIYKQMFTSQASKYIGGSYEDN